MMEAQIRLAGGKITLKLTGDSPKKLFSAVAEAQGLFEAETNCGLCGSDQIRYVVRTVNDDEYYELRCVGVDPKTGYVCNAQFNFGQNKKGGGLFPKRKDKDDQWMPNRGWYRWQGKSTTASSARNDDSDDAPF